MNRMESREQMTCFSSLSPSFFFSFSTYSSPFSSLLVSKCIKRKNRLAIGTERILSHLEQFVEKKCNNFFRRQPTLIYFFLASCFLLSFSLFFSFSNFLFFHTSFFFVVSSFFFIIFFSLFSSFVTLRTEHFFFFC